MMLLYTTTGRTSYDYVTIHRLSWSSNFIFQTFITLSLFVRFISNFHHSMFLSFLLSQKWDIFQVFVFNVLRQPWKDDDPCWFTRHLNVTDQCEDHERGGRVWITILAGSMDNMNEYMNERMSECIISLPYHETYSTSLFCILCWESIFNIIPITFNMPHPTRSDVPYIVMSGWQTLHVLGKIQSFFMNLSSVILTH